MYVSKEEVEANQTPNGGYTKAQLAKWDVPWPPPKGWKSKLTALPPPLKCSKCTYVATGRADLNNHWLLEH